ncbi:MAG TPA: beta-ketoacyl-[acyl-carrier-protein] synthase family protein [Pirellulaceae bacterium]|jgi:3-oxoacyl-(acyl-carrier-protein) synthase|nr:beta-ketoacyl-[acyl-carrier-protein] synthase family protein [Pirellulaceae bacterium]
MPDDAAAYDPVVITGIGLITSLGHDRETVWNSIRAGRHGFARVTDLPWFRGEAIVAARVEWDDPVPGQLKAISLAQHAAREAMADAGFPLACGMDPTRFGIAVAGHMGDSSGIGGPSDTPKTSPDQIRWWEQVLPNTGCSHIANEFGILGPRLTHSVACASGLVSLLVARRAILDGQCDAALVGGAEALDPMFVACFRNMRALSPCEDPEEACRPFDRNRTGFVMGEGASLFVIERLSHALARGAKVYAEVQAGRILCQAHHVTRIDLESESLAKLIECCLDSANLEPEAIGYVNAHGTGTMQNDSAEMRGIASAMGSALGDVYVSATKSMIGHLVNAAGCAELAVTALAMRDGYAPATLNLTDPDAECVFDALPLVGRKRRFQYALKLSMAFGGHLVGAVLKRWNDPATGFAYPDESPRALAGRRGLRLDPSVPRVPAPHADATALVET